MISDFLISEEVKNALNQNLPIVALESTIITHGMEFPENMKTALEVEEIIRSQGAVPATIAIIEGKIRVGLTKNEIEFTAQNSKSFTKATTRDIPGILIKKQNSGTTVAATMYIAHKAGIKFFVTGGIGGVHRDVVNSWDISADLLELSRTPVCVISAGIKSILDIPKTLEYLETNSVPVVGFKTKKFPEFFFCEGDSNVSLSLDSEEECGQLVSKTYDDLGMKCGILIANPVPKEFEADKEKVLNAIEKALEGLKEKKISGANVTPFLLKEVNLISGGDSCKTNIELIKNNAKVGGKIAVEYSKISVKK